MVWKWYLECTLKKGFSGLFSSQRSDLLRYGKYGEQADVRSDLVLQFLFIKYSTCAWLLIPDLFCVWLLTSELVTSCTSKPTTLRKIITQRNKKWGKVQTWPTPDPLWKTLFCSPSALQAATYNTQKCKSGNIMQVRVNVCVWVCKHGPSLWDVDLQHKWMTRWYMACPEVLMCSDWRRVCLQSGDRWACLSVNGRCPSVTQRHALQILPWQSSQVILY